MFNLLILPFCVLAYVFPLCTDQVLNIYNMHEEFVINNVRGVGNVGITDNIRQYIKQHFMFNKTISGRDIYDEVLAYAKNVRRLSKLHVFHLVTNMNVENKHVENLIDFDKLFITL